MKNQNMNLPVLVICAFLLQSVLAEDDEGYPKLSGESVTQTVTKTVVTKVQATQPPQVMGRGPIPPHLYNKTNVLLKWVEWSGSLPQWAVKVNMNETGQEDYVCAPRTGCNMTTGFYNPSKGPFCFHTCDGKEEKSSDFEILVNEGVLAKDDDGYLKLYSETVTANVTETEGTMVDGKQPPRGRTRLRSNHRSNEQDKKSFLKWVSWSGSLPQWAVKVHIPGRGREDYICMYDGFSGYYNPSSGPFCFVSYRGQDSQYSQFDILVNEHNLELLEWKAFDHGVEDRVPANKMNMNHQNMFVAKTRYGIGAINAYYTRSESVRIINGRIHSDISSRAEYNCYLHGSSNRHEECDILTVQTGDSEVTIHNMVYLIDNLAMLFQKPSVLNQMRVENHNCRDIEQEVNLQGSTERQSSWETSLSNSLTLSASLQVTVPFVSVTAGVEYSNSKTVTNGNSLTETVSHSLTVKVNVPPNHSCVVKMAGKTKNFNIPYKAQLSRKFPNGKVQTGTVSGTYKGVQVGEIYATAERCEPIPNARPC